MRRFDLKTNVPTGGKTSDWHFAHFHFFGFIVVAAETMPSRRQKMSKTTSYNSHCWPVSEV